jgi:voltage-gated potassium channel
MPVGQESAHSFREVIMIRNLLSKIINSNRNLTITFCLIIFSSAFCYSTSENIPFLDALWWSIVTATTVGYGDTFPHNMLGKIAAIVLMLSMVLLIIPAITARMASGLIVNNDAFTHSEQEELKQGMRKIVAYLEKQQGSGLAIGNEPSTPVEPQLWRDHNAEVRH